MSTIGAGARSTPQPLARPSATVPRLLLRLLALAVIDAFAIWLIYSFVQDSVWFLAVILAVITVAINVIFLWEDLYPLRWMAPGLALMILMVVYPLIFTIYTAFTNYSDGHLLSKKQAVQLLQRSDTYLPEDAPTYSWTAFRSPTGEYALWLVPEGGGEALLARPGAPAQPGAPGTAGVGELDQNGVPTSIEGFQRLERRDTVRYLSELDELEFGVAPDVISIASLSAAARYQPRYQYDPAQDAILDQETGTLYRADEQEGAFVSEDGQTLRPGYQVVIGAQNFRRFFTSSALRGPLLRIFVWTIGFSLVSVLLSFALGLGLALAFNDPLIRGRKIIRSFLLIPYTIPSFISILIWRGMLNPHLGVISTNMERIFGWVPGWFSDPVWAKVAILLINLWLGFPYMMLLCSGALQGIPTDIYEAAAIDGATARQRFWSMTLPLLLVSVGPLLISSFAFNFNNFNIIYLFNSGGPPMAGTPTPAGHTDILISYTFNLAFAGGRGADYGYAAAIAIIIFLIVASITLFQFRYTKMLEEVSENV